MDVTSGLVRSALRLLDHGGGYLRRLGVEPVSLDEEPLLRAARRTARMSAFGGEEFREPLGVLLRALRTEARLTLAGQLVARGDIVGLLVNRLRLEQDRRHHPGIANERIQRPVFVVGLPRTGSTLLHHLLAQDPDARVARAWEVMEPSPPPAKARYESDPRIRRASRRLAWFDRLAPDFKKIHPLGAELPLECIAIMSASFLSPRFHTTYHVPSYQAWLAGADLQPAYDFHRRFLQHLQWRMPAGRWVLKAPSHMFGLTALFATYPDAVVVHTHRDPVVVLASVASLTLVLQQAFSRHLDPAEIGAEVTERWTTGLALAMRARRDPGLTGRFFDVHYGDLMRDPMTVVRRVYSRFDLPLSSEAESRMRDFILRSPKDRHGAHRYSLSAFGLDAHELGRRFKSYCECFGVERDSAARA